MREIPLTPKQSAFAESCHDLVYRFLNDNHLPEDEYYDVVIFGYLRAVRRYFTEPKLQQYSFSTIAWKAMFGALGNDKKAKLCSKRDAEILSLDVALYEDDLTLEEKIPAPNPLMRELETKLLFHELAKRISGQQMEMVRLRSDGYGIREIARSQKLPLQRVKELLEEVRVVLLELSHE